MNAHVLCWMHYRYRLAVCGGRWMAQLHWYTEWHKENDPDWRPG